MSHNARVPMKIKYREELVTALESIFGIGKVEVFEGNTGIAHGYHGQQNEASVIVRRDTCGGYGDLSFIKGKDGLYSMVKDDLLRFDVKRLVGLYAKEVIRNRIQQGVRGGRFRTMETDDNHVKLQDLA
jgi:hypothetical protein